MSLNLKGKIQIVGQTHEGQVRDHNEDFISDNDTLGLAVLADGMGGLYAGEVASSMAVHRLMEELIAYRLGESQLAEALVQGEGRLPIEAQVVRKSVEETNEAVFHVSQTQPECRGMGTTIIVSMFYDNRVTIAHIGDSRVYRYRTGTLAQVTKDHSFVQELLDKGLYTRDEARALAHQNREDPLADLRRR